MNKIDSWLGQLTLARRQQQERDPHEHLRGERWGVSGVGKAGRIMNEIGSWLGRLALARGQQQERLTHASI